ncbi:hypothetical protein QAD02_002775 [Eretmocerus hayati]|uniref:Uncharacterized protein n=1 Tax=Eretmocerus hayati TaxID=131215 RepID=A0ACC2NLL3_9HYME|nr:hypothetical protein QAD02_002775 [Eretmocerus hayati]
MPKTGCFLGGLTNKPEAYGPDSYIKKFASGGPKLYAYVLCKSDGEEVEKSTTPRELIGNTSLFNDGSDTPLTNLKRKYGRISRHFSDSAVTPSNLAEPPQSGEEKEADNVEDCSEVFNETADSTLGYSTPGTKKKKPSWATLTLNK